MSTALEEREGKNEAYAMAHACRRDAGFAKTRFVAVCLTACGAAREVIPGNGAMGAVSGLLQHLTIGAESSALRLT